LFWDLIEQTASPVEIVVVDELLNLQDLLISRRFVFPLGVGKDAGGKHNREQDHYRLRPVQSDGQLGSAIAFHGES
jgi:hypothetical protein